MTIAVTGGVAEGKSTVLGFMAEFGVPVHSADVLAREMLERERKAVEAIFGGPFSREALRERVLEDPLFRRALNQIMHPPIVARLRGFHGAAEIPLLVETCRLHEVDRIIVVTCGPVEQRRRLVARLGDEGLADRLLGTQLPTRAKIPFAHAVIRTDSALETVRVDTRSALREIGWPVNLDEPASGA